VLESYLSEPICNGTFQTKKQNIYPIAIRFARSFAENSKLIDSCIVKGKIAI